MPVILSSLIYTLTTIILTILVSTSTQVSIDKLDLKPNGDPEISVLLVEVSPSISPPPNVPPINTSNEWTPDLQNDIWKELNFPVEPEDQSIIESSSAPPTIDSNFDINELNLTNIENRVAGGKLACQCGIPYNRIVNGEAAKINDIPWTVALTRKGTFSIFGGSSRPFCGGTLINDRYVVTASHCVDGQTEKGIIILLNEQDFLVSTETIGETRKIGVNKIIMHPNYNKRNVDNDIALIRLDTPINFKVNENAPLVPVCLPANNNNDFNGLTATVAGWGTTRQGGGTSTSLQKVSVPIITNEECNSKQTKYTGKITNSMLCAGHTSTGGKDACQGDSGGPLIVNNGPERKTLVGIVSWGYGCAQKNAPGVYTRVAKYPDWILANTKDAEWCSE